MYTLNKIFLSKYFQPRKPFLFLNSFLPNHLFSETVSQIESTFSKRRWSIQTEITLAIIVSSHSKSSTVTDRAYFIRRGFAILKILEERIKIEISDRNEKNELLCVIMYNTGRAYHQFGILGFAESYYKNSLVSQNIELRRLALFNLSIIYRRNKSTALPKELIKKYYPLTVLQLLKNFYNPIISVLVYMEF